MSMEKRVESLFWKQSGKEGQTITISAMRLKYFLIAKGFGLFQLDHISISKMKR